MNVQYFALGQPQQIRLFARHLDLGREVWVVWDHDAEVFELYTSERADTWLATVDWLSEAREIAMEYFSEMMMD